MAIYDAFISYSHAKDKPLAAALQSVVQKLGKPWYKRRAARVFRDDTSLAASPHLWPSIEQALNQSRFLIVIASPEFAASRWCAKEVEFWLAHKGIDTILVALSDGELAWDEGAGDFAWTNATPLPAALKGRFLGEPKWGDLRAFRQNPNRRDPGFLDRAADFAAGVRGIPQEDLLSEELQQQRRALGLAWSAAAFMLVLGALAAWQWKLAIDNEREARLQRDRAVVSERIAVEQRDRAERTLAAATETANSLVVELAREFRAREGVPIALVRRILERAQALQRQLIESGEATADLKYSEAMALYELVATYLAQGDKAAALQAAERYRGIIEGLLAANPDNTLWQQVLGTGFTTLGDILRNIDRPDEAIEAFRKSVAIWEKLVAKNPQNTEWSWGLASGYHRLADHLDDQGQFDEAFVAYGKSLTIWERLAAAQADNPDWQVGLSTSYEGLAWLHFKKARYDEALEAFSKSLAICEKLTAFDPTRGDWQGRLALAHAAIGETLGKAGRIEEAIAALQKSYEIRVRLAASDPGNVGWQRDVINAELRLGPVLREAHRHQEAAVLYRKAVANAERLLAAGPENEDRQADLVVCLQRLGDTLVYIGQRDEALAAYHRALELAEQMASRSPDNAQWQSNLAAVLFKLGKAGDNAEPRMRRALDILRNLSAAGKLKPNQSDWIAEIEQALAALPK